MVDLNSFRNELLDDLLRCQEDKELKSIAVKFNSIQMEIKGILETLEVAFLQKAMQLNVDNAITDILSEPPKDADGPKDVNQPEQ